MRSGDIHAHQGLAAFDQGDYPLVVDELTQAIADGIAAYDLARLYTVLGRAYQKLKQSEQARAAYEQALEINPEYYQAWNNLGILYFDCNHYQEAEKCHQKALAIEPEYAFALASLGAVQIHRNAPQEAIAVLEQALVLVPGMAVAHANLALAYALVGRFEEAENELQQATLMGYKHWREVQVRISNLADMRSGSSPANRAEWLPSNCSCCGAPLSASTVSWQSRNAADCGHCGAHIARKASPG